MNELGEEVITSFVVISTSLLLLVDVESDSSEDKNTDSDSKNHWGVGCSCFGLLSSFSNGVSGFTRFTRFFIVSSLLIGSSFIVSFLLIGSLLIGSGFIVSFLLIGSLLIFSSTERNDGVVDFVKFVEELSSLGKKSILRFVQGGDGSDDGNGSKFHFG